MKLKQEQLLYAQAMEKALQIAKGQETAEQGVEELEKNVRFRQSNPIPCNVSLKELDGAVSKRYRDDRMFMVTAMAVVLTDRVKMPPSMVKEYLSDFKKIYTSYLEDKELFEADGRRLDDDYAMIEYLKMPAQEDMKDGEN